MEKMADLRNQLKEKMSAGGLSQVSVARATGIDQGVLSHFLKEPDYGLGGKNALRLTEWIKEQEGFPATSSAEGENIISRIRDLEARIADQAARLADKDEIIALQREKIAEQKEKIAALEGKIPVYSDIREQLEALRKNQEMFARVHMLAKLATREGQALSNEIGLSQEAFVKNMESEEILEFWRSLGEKLVRLANFSHISSEVVINLERYLSAFRCKNVDEPSGNVSTSSSGDQVA